MSILDGYSQMRGTRIKKDKSNERGKPAAQSYIQQQKTKKEYLKEIEKIKFCFDDFLYKNIRESIITGDLIKKRDSETWNEYANRLIPIEFRKREHYYDNRNES